MSVDALRDYQAKLATPSQNLQVVVLRFFMNSLEYQRIYNFPQHGLQFLAEVGGLMAFFLGISVISLFECFFYVVTCAPCGGCCNCGEDDDVDEELPPPRDRDRSSPPQRRRRPDLSRFENDR